MRSLRQLVSAAPATLSATPAPRRVPTISTVAAMQRRLGNEGLRALVEQRPSSAAAVAPTARTSIGIATGAAPVADSAPSPAKVSERPPTTQLARTQEGTRASPAASAPGGTTGGQLVPSAKTRAQPVSAGPAKISAAGAAEAAKGGEEVVDVRAADAARLDALKHQVSQTARGQKTRAKSKALVAQTRRSAIAPGPEGQNKASEATLKKLDATDKQTDPIEKAKTEFKDALKKKLLQAMPDSKSGEDAKKAVSPETGNLIAGEMKGELTAAQSKTTGNLPEAAKSPEDPKSYAPGEAPALTPTSPGTSPAVPSAAGAVPDKMPDAALDTQQDRNEADAQLASENLSQDQLKRSNEPSFVDAANTRDEAERHSEAGPPEVRKAEQEARGQAQGRARNALGHGVLGMFGARAARFLGAFAQQNAAKAKEEAQRAQIGQDLDNIQRKTSNDVKQLLDYMDVGAQLRFDFGLIAARQAFENQLVKTEAIIRKINRDDALSSGNLFSAASAAWGDLSADDAELTIRWARRAYNKEIDRVIDDVANFIGPILVRITQRIAQGKQEAADYVGRLDKSVAEIGAGELERVNGEFDNLSVQVEQRRDALIIKISESYEASKKAIEERAQAFRDANKSWWQKLKEKVRGVIRAIIQIKDMFATILKRVAGVVGAILSDPAGFLGNLVTGVKRGLSNFISNFLTHLKEGFFEWLFGTAAKAGIQVPKKFDAAGIFMLLASILGLTVANIRARAVAKVGEGPVKALETGAGILMTLKEKGLAGLWEMLVEKLNALKDSVIEQVQSMLTTEVIKAGITWIIGLLNPAAGFIKACKAIYEIVKFFINNWDRIVEFVNSVLDSIGAIAKGQLDAAAALVEKTLARTIPIIIGFLAGLLGLGNIAEKVKKIIERIQAPVNRAIDWVIDKAVSLVKAGAGLAAKTAKGVFNWVRAKVGFKDADGKRHSIFVAPGATPTLSIASDPTAAEAFLDAYLDKKGKQFSSSNASKIADVRKSIKKSQGIVDKIAKLNRDVSKDPTAQELKLLEELLQANVILSQALSDLIGRDDTTVGTMKEKYLLEGMTGTYSSIPKPKSDQLTADHQPQAAILQACAEFDYLDTSGVHERAAKRASKGFAINLHFNRHIAGRTFGGKGTATKNDFWKVLTKIEKTTVGKNSKDIIKKQRKLAVAALRHEIKADYDQMIKVAHDKKNYEDITEEKNLGKQDKEELITGIRGRIETGEREMLAQDLDTLVDD